MKASEFIEELTMSFKNAGDIYLDVTIDDETLSGSFSAPPEIVALAKSMRDGETNV
jgi:hypothetical protein